MPRHDSVVHPLLKYLPWHELDAAVARHDAAGCVRRFSFRSQVVAMLHAQSSGAASLRHVACGLHSLPIGSTTWAVPHPCAAP